MPRVVLVGGADDGHEEILSSLAPLPLTIRLEPRGTEYALDLNKGVPVCDRYGRIVYRLESPAG